MNIFPSNKIQLLDAVAAGKILFQHQPHLTKFNMQRKIYALRDKENLPMKLFNGRWKITLRALEKWIGDKGL